MTSPVYAAVPEWTTWPSPQNPPLSARRTVAPPLIDGKPDDAVWRDAVWTSAFMDMVDASAPWLHTEAALLWDDRALYVAVRMQEPRLEATISERDGPVYRDPDFELFIAGANAYWEIEVNARNTVYDVFWIWRDAFTAAQGYDPTLWDVATRRVLPLVGIGEHRHPRGERSGFIDADLPGLQVAVATTGTCNDNSDQDTGWTVEMAIPWAALEGIRDARPLPPRAGDSWRMNLSRFVSRAADGEALPPLRPAGWTLTRHGVFDSHVPERFARVVFEEAPTPEILLPTEKDVHAYLSAHLPPEDRILLGADTESFLIRHAAFVARVVKESPWRTFLSPDLVYNYLLAPRVTDEPLEAWPEALRAELLPILRSLPEPCTLTDAALRIRRWLGERVVPGQSAPWSMGPLTLLRGGAGRCEELGILFVCAARSVGIPARICYTPAWRGGDGNHLWVEFWNGQGWSALSPEQTDASPDSGWFYPQLDKAAVVLARAFGAPPAQMAAGDTLQAAHSRGFTLNRTAAYTNAGSLRVQVYAADGRPQPAPVLVHIFNAGRPRTVVGERSADAFFVLGTGTYLVSVAPESLDAEAHAAQIVLRTVTVQKGQDTEIRIDLPPDTAQNPSQKTAFIEERKGYTSPQHEHQPTPPGPPQRPLPAPVDGLCFTDFLYADPAMLDAENKAAAQAWAHFWGDEAASPALTALFEPYVAAGRVGGEPFSHWRILLGTLLEQGTEGNALPALHTAPVHEKAAPEGAGLVVPGDALATAARVQGRLTRLFVGVAPSSSRPLPLSALLRVSLVKSSEGLVLTPKQAPMLSIAALRSVGIPARLAAYESDSPWAEFFDGKTWLPLYPQAPQALGNKAATAEARACYGPQGRFALHRADTAQPALEPAGQGHTWTLCRLTKQGGFVPLTASVSEDGSCVMVPVGDYALVQNQRDAEGWNRWTVELVRVKE